MPEKNNWNTFKKISILIGSIVVVYILFRVVLPLIFPFLLAFITVMLLRPAIIFISHKFYIKENISAVVVITIVIAAAAWILNKAGIIFMKETEEVMKAFNPYKITEKLRQILGDKIFIFGIDINKAIISALEQIEKKLSLDACVGYCVSHTPAIINKIVEFITVLFIYLIACILAAGEMQYLHQRMIQTVYYHKFVDFGLYLRRVCGKWVKAQLVIMSIVSVVSVLGLWICGFSCALLIGFVIGFVDMLPIFGSGTIYIPWIIWEFINKDAKKAVFLIVIYLICYCVREFLESHMMGNSMGITAFEFMAAVYIGIKLFGVSGVLLGPLCVLIVKWIYDTLLNDERCTS